MPDAWGNIAVAPQIISSDVATITGGANAVTANIVYLYAFELLFPVTIVGTRWHAGSTPTGSTSMGIYTAAGNIVSGSDTGPHVNVASTTSSFSYVTPITLLPGQYFIALSCNAADLFQAVAPTSSDMSRAKRATNTLAAGALPLTTGAIVTSTFIVPGMALLVSGGLL